MTALVHRYSETYDLNKAVNGRVGQKSRGLTSAAQFVDVIYLDLSKAFDTVSHGILLAAHGFNRCIVCCLKNWLDVWDQRGGEWCHTQFVASLWWSSSGLNSEDQKRSF